MPNALQHGWLQKLGVSGLPGSDDNNDGAAAAPADAAAPPTDQGNGTVTIPEVTIVGDPSQANADPAAADAPSPLPPLAAAGVVVTPTPIGPPGMPPDPSIIDQTPWSPISGGGGSASGAASGSGAATAGAGTDAAAGGAAAATGDAAATGTAVVAGDAAATATGAGVLTAGAVAGAVLVGGPIVGAAVVIGAAFLSGGISRTENAPDPDDVASGHGVAGAPPQNASGSNDPHDVPADDDPDGGAPAQAPGAQSPAAASDPDTPPSAQAPSAGTDDPADLAKKKNDRDAPADDLDDGEGRNRDGTVRRKPGKHGENRGRESKRADDEDFERVCDELDLDEDQRRRLHDAISGRNLGYDGIKDEALAEFPDKRERAPSQ